MQENDQLNTERLRQLQQRLLQNGRGEFLRDDNGESEVPQSESQHDQDDIDDDDAYSQEQ